EPLAHQWFPLMPLPMNITPNRFGKTRAALGADAAASVAAPQTLRDSSQGNAMVTPTPRRKRRREIILRRASSDFGFGDCIIYLSARLFSGTRRDRNCGVITMSLIIVSK